MIGVIDIDLDSHSPSLICWPYPCVSTYWEFLTEFDFGDGDVVEANESRALTTSKVEGLFDHSFCPDWLGSRGVVVMIETVEEATIGDDSLGQEDVEPIGRLGRMGG